MDIKASSSEAGGQRYLNPSPFARHIADHNEALFWTQRLCLQPLLNNRFLAFTGMGRFQYPSLEAWEDVWIIESGFQNSSLCILDTGPELMICHYENIEFQVSAIQYLKNRFSRAEVLTLHEPIASRWKSVAKGVGYLSTENLKTILYSVQSASLQRFEDPSLVIRRCSSLDRQLYYCIEGFFRDAMHKKAKKSEILACFQRNEFVGLYVKSQLVSILAKTRRIPEGQCISYVYTPVRFRGHGYSKFLVSGVTKVILSDSRIRQVFLYADIENPISNLLYQSLGFKECCKCITFVR